jgi:predicted DNA-binding protein YlxM (UPF0122 family)
VVNKQNVYKEINITIFMDEKRAEDIEAAMQFVNEGDLLDKLMTIYIDGLSNKLLSNSFKKYFAHDLVLMEEAVKVFTTRADNLYGNIETAQRMKSDLEKRLADFKEAAEPYLT